MLVFRVKGVSIAYTPRLCCGTTILHVYTDPVRNWLWRIVTASKCPRCVSIRSKMIKRLVNYFEPLPGFCARDGPRRKQIMAIVDGWNRAVNKRCVCKTDSFFVPSPQKHFHFFNNALSESLARKRHADDRCVMSIGNITYCGEWPERAYLLLSSSPSFCIWNGNGRPTSQSRKSNLISRVWLVRRSSKNAL